MIFQANRAYKRELDVREDYQGLEQQVMQEPPEGVLWLLLAPRRWRKTWTLQAIKARLEPHAEYLHLQRDGSLPRRPPRPGHCFLLDEPLLRLRNAETGRALIAACHRLSQNGARVVMAVTPGELERLIELDQGRGWVSEKALLRIPHLTAEESERLAERHDRAAALLDQLRPIWKRSAFLLELLFELQERSPHLDARALLRAVLERCGETAIRYFQHVFQQGLTEAQRTVVRRAARSQPLTANDCGCLLESGLIERDADGRLRLNDPILEVHFSPLRVHHLSDIHVGPKSAAAADIKTESEFGDAANQGAVRETYVQHLKRLKACQQAPHLVVISGDLSEWATAEQFAEARDWVERVRCQLQDHLQLDVQDARVLLVGGNHDVDWRQTKGKGPHARHRPFAESFASYHRPRLEEPPDSRPVAVARYPDFGVEFLLLGSAEFGGEVDEDQERGRLLRELAELQPPHAAEQVERARELALRAARDDPGLVHHKDLARAAAHSWSEPVRIAVLHHPVSPLPSVTEVARYAGMLNAGAVKDMLLECGFCLVLHGHAHAGWFSVEQWPGLHADRKLRIAAAPSLSSRETVQDLGFNVIEIERDHGENGQAVHRVAVRRFVRKGAQNWEDIASLPPFTTGVRET